VKLFTDLHEAGTELLVPATVVAEVGYLLAREAGSRVESLFLRSLADGDFSIVELTIADYARMADLVVTYASLPLGTTDASVLALAERLKLTEIATLDRRHFTVVRPDHVNALTLLP
jgi:predicted nucleic acid-binding protein